MLLAWKTWDRAPKAQCEGVQGTACYLWCQGDTVALLVKDVYIVLHIDRQSLVRILAASCLLSSPLALGHCAHRRGLIYLYKML